jgi:hypothetical protein
MVILKFTTRGVRYRKRQCMVFLRFPGIDFFCDVSSQTPVFMSMISVFISSVQSWLEIVLCCISVMLFGNVFSVGSVGSMVLFLVFRESSSSSSSCPSVFCDS